MSSTKTSTFVIRSGKFDTIRQKEIKLSIVQVLIYGFHTKFLTSTSFRLPKNFSEKGSRRKIREKEEMYVITSTSACLMRLPELLYAIPQSFWNPKHSITLATIKKNNSIPAKTRTWPYDSVLSVDFTFTKN